MQLVAIQIARDRTCSYLQECLAGVVLVVVVVVVVELSLVCLGELLPSLEACFTLSYSRHLPQRPGGLPLSGWISDPLVDLSPLWDCQLWKDTGDVLALCPSIQLESWCIGALNSKKQGGWRNSPEVKSVFCSCRGSGFGSQHSHWMAHPSPVTPGHLRAGAYKYS